MKKTKTHIVPAKGHHITPHLHKVKGTIHRDAPLSARQGYGSKGNYRPDLSQQKGR